LLELTAQAVGGNLRCIGCGLCISVCPADALRLEPREGMPVPPFDRREFNVAMMSSIQEKK